LPTRPSTKRQKMTGEINQQIADIQSATADSNSRPSNYFPC
jgi:hypothetical protein